MKQITTILLILVAGMAYAGDSTLYKKRIEKLRSLHEWLVSRPFSVPGVDTSLALRMYDTVVNKFFDKKHTDSLLAIKHEDDMFDQKTKYYFFLAGIATFNELARKLCFDSLLFKPDKVDAKLDKEDSISVENSIIQYFIINGKEEMYMLFEFIEGSTTLLEIPILGHDPEVTQYYRRLKPCAKK